LTSKIDADCLIGKDGLPAVADIYDDDSESQNVAMIKPIWRVIAAQKESPL
jgi:hypothetical protein